MQAGQGGNPGTVKSTTLTGNSGSGGSFEGLFVGTTSPVGNSISKTTIKNNTFTNNARSGILVDSDAPSASISGVMIPGNTASNNLVGIAIEDFGPSASGNSIVATVHNSTLTGNSSTGTSGLFITSGFSGATNNTVKVTNTGNIVSGNTGSGIGVAGG